MMDLVEYYFKNIFSGVVLLFIYIFFRILLHHYSDIDIVSIVFVLFRFVFLPILALLDLFFSFYGKRWYWDGYIIFSIDVVSSALIILLALG